jgi:hypothetical protein
VVPEFKLNGNYRQKTMPKFLSQKFFPTNLTFFRVTVHQNTIEVIEYRVTLFHRDFRRI